MNWQETLDDLFPHGAAVTQVNDVYEGVGFDDSPSFLTPRFVVTSETEAEAEVTLQIVEFEKDVSLTLVKIEKMSPGFHLFHTPDEGPDFLVSTNLADEVRNSLRKIRREWYEEE